jgi:hypothetical protein
MSREHCMEDSVTRSMLRKSGAGFPINHAQTTSQSTIALLTDVVSKCRILSNLVSRLRSRITRRAGLRARSVSMAEAPT